MPLVLVIACTPQDETCFCDGDELDFAVVGALAGEWSAEEFSPFVFDGDDRPRGLEDLVFGCAPTEYPLVLGGETRLNATVTPVIRRLEAAIVGPGFFDLTYAQASRTNFLRLRAELAGETLTLHHGYDKTGKTDIAFDSTFTYTRTSPQPANRPEVPQCEP